MSHLARRHEAEPVEYLDPDPLLSAQIAGAQRPGIATAARIQSGAFATSTGLHNAVMLSQAVDNAFRVSPMGESAYRRIFEAFATFAAQEIERLGFQNGGR
jgi:hypothetical protein